MPDQVLNSTQVIVDETPGWPDIIAPSYKASATSESVRLVARGLAQRTAFLLSRQSAVLSGTRLERRNLPLPSEVTRFVETDTGVSATYIPGLGWRGAYGDDLDALPSPPVEDTGVI